MFDSNYLHSKMKEFVEPHVSSVELSVLHKGAKVYSEQFGRSYKFYDWASLTKIVFTTSILMTLVDRKLLRLDDRLQKWLPWFRYPHIQLSQLLSHRAGFTWWRPYYQLLDPTLKPVERWQQLQILLRQERPTRPVTKAVYSDLDMFFLGAVNERVLSRPLINIWDDYSNEMGFASLHFCVNNKPRFTRSHYAPTEDCPWRKKVLQGEVHDENTWALGGVAPHAGLFGPMTDLEKWGQSLRQSYFGLPGGFVSRKTARLFLRPSPGKVRGDWAYGFMMPTPGSSSAGDYFSPLLSFGHTGFTGTSFWWDASCDVMVLILANRVFPTRNNKTFVQLRPRIHNWVREALPRK